MLGETDNQFSLTRAAFSTGGRAKSDLLSVVSSVKEEARRHEATTERLTQTHESLLTQVSILNLMAEALIAADPEGVIQQINPAAELLTGYASAELTGQSLSLLSPFPEPERRAKFEALRARVGARWFGDLRLRRKDGVILIVRTSITASQVRGKPMLIGLCQDVSAQKRAEAELRNREERLRLGLETARMVTWEYDMATHRIAFSDNLEAFLGGGPVEPYLSLPTILEKIHIEDREPLVKAITDALSAQATFEHPFRCQMPDGAYRWTLNTGRGLLNEQGQISRIVGLSSDITARQRLERQILDISDREQARIGQDIHDGLCQQLVSLAFDANALHRKMEARHSPDADAVRRIADCLDGAITESRQLSRGLFPIRLDAEGLSSALEELAKATAERYSLVCQFESFGGPVPLNKPTATHLYRIAREAVNNAVKHGRPTRIALRLDSRGGAVEMRVEDNGAGLPAASAAEASGMGLHIMDYRARTIGATLRLSPGPDGGTSVSCCVPRRIS